MAEGLSLIAERRVVKIARLSNFAGVTQNVSIRNKKGQNENTHFVLTDPEKQQLSVFGLSSFLRSLTTNIGKTLFSYPAYFPNDADLHQLPFGFSCCGYLDGSV